VKQGLLDRLSKSKERSYDAWLERDHPADPTQFIQIQPLDQSPFGAPKETVTA
jgi:nitrite reductase (NADH) large subunit